MLSENEVAEIMKKEIPALLHARIKELEFNLERAVVACELYIDYSAESAISRLISDARKCLEKDVI